MPAEKRTGRVVRTRDGRLQGIVILADGRQHRLSPPYPRGMSRAMAKTKTLYWQGVIDANGGMVLATDVEQPEPIAAADSCEPWFDLWIADRKARGYSATAENSAHFRRYITPAIGEKHMRDWTRDDLRKLSHALDVKVQAGEMAWKTAWNVWGTATKMCSDAAESKRDDLRCRDDNPAMGLRGPDRGDHRAKAYLYPSEFLAVMKCARVPLKWRRMIAVATCTYVRAAELRALTWEDVDVERGIIHVHHTEDRQGRDKPTKTGITRRFAVEPCLLPLLRAMRREAGGAGHVVALPRDTHLAGVLRDMLQRAGVKRADLFADDKTRKPMTWHDLRATGLTWLAVRGEDPLKIMQRAGHTDFHTTQIYVREAESLRAGFGDVFPPLPEALLAGEVITRSDHSAASMRNLVTPPGLEPGLPA